MPHTRPYQASDRAGVLLLVHDGRAIDSRAHHLHVAEDAGAIVGVAIWIEPQGGDTGYLTISGPPPGAPPHIFYRLAEAACSDAIAHGLTFGQFIIRNRGLLRRLERDFAVDARPNGWDPPSGRTTEWSITVDLQDALRQLQPYL